MTVQKDPFAAFCDAVDRMTKKDGVLVYETDEDFYIAIVIEARLEGGKFFSKTYSLPEGVSPLQAACAAVDDFFSATRVKSPDDSKFVDGHILVESIDG